MLSLRFPFSFSRPTSPPNPISHRCKISSAAVGCTVAAAGIAAGVAITRATSTSQRQFLQNALNYLCSNNLPRSHYSRVWASLTVSDISPFVDPRTGLSFPSILNDSQKLLGVGLRRKSLFGLKNIDVYAFGIYADENKIKRFLSGKYGNVTSSELESKNVIEDLIESDVSVTIRLQIVYGKLSIRSVRGAFEESIGTRIRKLGGPDDKDVLQRFTAQFKDEYKIPKGSVIELSKEDGYVLRTRIEGEEIGSVQSKVLCKSVLDVYIGGQPFDHQAKEDVEMRLASIVSEPLPV